MVGSETFPKQAPALSPPESESAPGLLQLECNWYIDPNFDGIPFAYTRTEPCFSQYAQRFLVATAANTPLYPQTIYKAFLIDNYRHYNFSLDTVRVGRIGILYQLLQGLLPSNQFGHLLHNGPTFRQLQLLLLARHFLTPAPKYDYCDEGRKPAPCTSFSAHSLSTV